MLVDKIVCENKIFFKCTEVEELVIVVVVTAELEFLAGGERQRFWMKEMNISVSAAMLLGLEEAEN